MTETPEAEATEFRGIVASAVCTVAVDNDLLLSSFSLAVWNADGDIGWYTVCGTGAVAETCRGLVGNGDHVIVVGVGSDRPWESAGKSGVTSEIAATSVTIDPDWRPTADHYEDERDRA